MVAPKTITIRKERFYAHPPEDVWAAITDPRALAEWLEPNNHQPVVGHKFQFRCDPGICGSGVTECEVLEVEAPRRLVWKWIHVPRSPEHPPSSPMTISWTLVPRELALDWIESREEYAAQTGWCRAGNPRARAGGFIAWTITKVRHHVGSSRRDQPHIWEQEISVGEFTGWCLWALWMPIVRRHCSSRPTEASYPIMAEWSWSEFCEEDSLKRLQMRAPAAHSRAQRGIAGRFGSGPGDCDGTAIAVRCPAYA